MRYIRNEINGSSKWMGFVDVMSSFLMIIIFCLIIFCISQAQLIFKNLNHEKTVNFLKSNIKKENFEKENLKKHTNQYLDTIDALEEKISLLESDIQSQKKIMHQKNSALKNIEKKNQKRILFLKERLNTVLLSQAPLSSYQKRIFKQIKHDFSNEKNIVLSGDNIILQSEIFFNSASAQLEKKGIHSIEKLANILKKITKKIPSHINWIIQIDGHTDLRPIHTQQFASNWELSTARAIAVVKELGNNGIPLKRLMAAGFGEFQPIDSEISQRAFQKNRRIELKLIRR